MNKPAKGAEKGINPVLPPSTSDREAWRTYWNDLGQSWRTEPEIPEHRQMELQECLNIRPDIKKGSYPFKNIRQSLNRADVEWLLAHHDDQSGLADWEFANHKNLKRGLDLRGADLRFVDLNSLPLPGLLGGLPRETWFAATEDQREAAAIHLEGANLSRTRLDMAVLRSAHLEGTNLSHAHLDKATLRGAHLEGKSLSLEDLSTKVVEAADLRYAFFDRATTLDGIILGNKEYGFARLGNVHWGEANLTDIDWSEVILGDEEDAHKKMRARGLYDKSTMLNAMRAAVQANRQLANVLRVQGVNDAANRFAFRAEVWQRKVLGRQGLPKLGAYLFSWSRFLLAGYGYRPLFSFLAYLVVILAFAAGYVMLAYGEGLHLSAIEALVLSVTSFHGRGFFPGDIPLDDPRTILAAFEALVGLLIEVSLISTFTQRFFEK
ncbi:MAG TPA: pentapeptide repeat-containing protein [Ktedonobacteraceae bacterium]|jgi:uncharacterized protein YjbI with pentapeptide repeats